MPTSLRTLKQLFTLAGSDRTRAFLLSAAERLGARKDILRMDTNDVCNIECIMCGNKPARCTDEHRMTLDSFATLLDRCARHTRLLYLSCSYEPLMTPKFTDYLAAAKTRRIPFVSFCTNALLLSEEIAEKTVDLGVDEIIVSYNGYTPDDYNRIMFRSDYNAVTRNLKRLVDYKSRKKSLLPRIRLNTILMKTNMLNFDHLVSSIEEYGIDSVQFREFKVDEAHNNNPEIIAGEMLSSLEEAQLTELTTRIRSTIGNLAKKGHTVILPSALLANSGVVTEKQAEKRGSCAVPFFSMWADFHGNIRICCGDNEGSMIGNILTEEPGLLSKRRDLFRKQALSGKCAMNCKMNLYSSTMM